MAKQGKLAVTMLAVTNVTMLADQGSARCSLPDSCNAGRQPVPAQASTCAERMAYSSMLNKRAARCKLLDCK